MTVKRGIPVISTSIKTGIPVISTSIKTGIRVISTTIKRLRVHGTAVQGLDSKNSHSRRRITFRSVTHARTHARTHALTCTHAWARRGAARRGAARHGTARNHARTARTQSRTHACARTHTRGYSRSMPHVHGYVHLSAFAFLYSWVLVPGVPCATCLAQHTRPHGFFCECPRPMPAI